METTLSTTMGTKLTEKISNLFYYSVNFTKYKQKVTFNNITVNELLSGWQQ